MDVEFLGHKVMQADVSSRLAIKFDAIIVPLFFTIYAPIEHKDFETENKILNLTQAQANIMEKHILEKPEQWFWQHKRFKEYNKEIYAN